MLAARVFLGFCGLVWLPYGVFCFLRPEFLGSAAGLVGTSATATTEIRAMYGGLQAGIGALCLWAVARPSLARTALVALSFIFGGLALTRVSGLLLDGGASGYTIGALVFEIPSTVIAVLLVRGWRPAARAEPA